MRFYKYLNEALSKGKYVFLRIGSMGGTKPGKSHAPRLAKRGLGCVPKIGGFNELSYLAMNDVTYGPSDPRTSVTKKYEETPETLTKRDHIIKAAKLVKSLTLKPTDELGTHFIPKTPGIESDGGAKVSAREYWDLLEKYIATLHINTKEYHYVMGKDGEVMEVFIEV